jgi:hypothetical protein
MSARAGFGAAIPRSTRAASALSESGEAISGITRRDAFGACFGSQVSRFMIHFKTSRFEEIALHYLRTIFRWVAAVSAFFGFGAIVAEMLKRWMENNGYLDHPEKGIAWVLSTLASISLYWWFYPALMFLIGLAIGLWTDLILRRFSDERQTHLDKSNAERV